MESTALPHATTGIGAACMHVMCTEKSSHAAACAQIRIHHKFSLLQLHVHMYHGSGRPNIARMRLCVCRNAGLSAMMSKHLAGIRSPILSLVSVQCTSAVFDSLFVGIGSCGGL